MIFILIGTVLFLATLFLLWRRRKKEVELAHMLESNSMSLRDLQKRIANNLSIDEGAEVKGKVTASEPLTAPFSFNKVVYYKCKIDRVYQEKIEFTGQDGQLHEKWESKTDTVFEEEDFIPFSLTDGSSEVRIDLKGAELTPEISYQSTEKVKLFSISDRFDEQPELKEKFTLLRSKIQDSNKGKDVVGFEFIEYTLPIHKDLFVLGGVGVQKDLPLLVKKDGMPFVASIRTAQQVYQEIDDKLQRYFLMAVLTGLAAIVCIFYGIKQMM
jgi:hypothetical protein